MNRNGVPFRQSDLGQSKIQHHTPRGVPDQRPNLGPVDLAKQVFRFAPSPLEAETFPEIKADDMG